MRPSELLVFMLAVGCVSSPDAGLSETEQGEWDGGPDDPEGEVIVIEGETGWPDWWFPGPGTPQDPSDTGDGYGGGTGPGGGPGPQPNRKECFATIPDDICLDCCFYNYDHVDGWKCRQYKEGSKKWRNCWADAADKLGDCQANTCNRHGPRPIVSSGGVSSEP
jgi:hypothetical protein